MRGKPRGKGEWLLMSAKGWWHARLRLPPGGRVHAVQYEGFTKESPEDLRKWLAEQSGRRVEDVPSVRGAA